jgi:diguanylate cyclase (GGDEF)-like protein
VVPSLEARLHVLLVGLAAVTIRTSVRLGAQARAAKGGLRTALITFVCFYSVLAVVLITIAVLAARSDPIQDVVDQHPIHAILLPALMLFLIGAAMSKLWVHYMHAYMEAKRAATFDPLTGVRNRRYFMPELERLFQRSKREGTRLACLMLDADTFKDVNDTYGHRKGDEVLQQLADRITDAVREYDLVGRYGGEEFIVVVPEREPQDVINMANRLHQSIRVTPLAGVELTVSVGVAFRSGHDVSTDDLIQRADRALYEAKRKGRDKIAVEHNDE